MTNTIFTIGHSTRPFDKFAEILEGFRIEIVVDVMTILAAISRIKGMHVL